MSSSDTKYKVSLEDKMTMISNAENNNNEFYKHINSSPLEKPLQFL